MRQKEYNFIIKNENFLEGDPKLFFDDEKVISLDPPKDMYDILVLAKVFKSRSEAKKNYKDKEIPEGFSDGYFGKYRIRITILNPRPSSYRTGITILPKPSSYKNSDYEVKYKKVTTRKMPNLRSVRQEFSEELYKQMKLDKNIWLVTADLGYGMWDKIRDDFPDRFINTGAAEQAASDICVGLALSGKTPFMYTITPFYYRCWETLRTYINHEKINVKLIGSGRDDDYKHDGFSHDATDMLTHLKCLSNIKLFWPEDKKEIPPMLKTMLDSRSPSFISLRR